jgi:hypothetical protein
MKEEQQAKGLVCAECGKQADAKGAAWKAFLTDEPDEIALYCPDCAEREFGESFRWVG